MQQLKALSAPPAPNHDEFRRMYSEPASPALVEAWRNGRIYGAREVYLGAYEQSRLQIDTIARACNDEIQNLRLRARRFATLSAAGGFIAGALTVAAALLIHMHK